MGHICAGPSVLGFFLHPTQALRPGLYNCRAFGPGYRKPQVSMFGLGLENRQMSEKLVKNWNIS